MATGVEDLARVLLWIRAEEDPMPSIARDELPPKALTDPFRPPARPVPVRCRHCLDEFSSDEMIWDGYFWLCPKIICGGAGFGFDIFPVDHVIWRASAQGP